MPAPFFLTNNGNVALKTITVEISPQHPLFPFLPPACSLEISTYILLGKGRLTYQVCFIHFALFGRVQRIIVPHNYLLLLCSSHSSEPCCLKSSHILLFCNIFPCIVFSQDFSVGPMLQATAQGIEEGYAAYEPASHSLDFCALPWLKSMI